MFRSSRLGSDEPLHVPFPRGWQRLIEIVSYLGQAVGWYHAGEAGGFIAAVVGALILLAIYRLFFHHRTA